MKQTERLVAIHDLRLLTHLQFLTILTDTKTKDAPSSIEEASKVLRQKLREEKRDGKRIEFLCTQTIGVKG